MWTAISSEQAKAEGSAMLVIEQTVLWIHMHYKLKKNNNKSDYNLTIEN